jgi:hypothetical protein
MEIDATVTGCGTIASTDGLLACPGGCTADFATDATLVATPDANCAFVGWGYAGCDDAIATCTIPLQASPLAIAPSFAATP